MDVGNKDCKTYVNTGNSHSTHSPGIALELYNQAMSLQFQITGHINKDTALCMTKIASIYYKFGDL